MSPPHHSSALPHGLVGSAVEAEDADPRCHLYVPEPLLAFGQGFLDSLAVGDVVEEDRHTPLLRIANPMSEGVVPVSQGGRLVLEALRSPVSASRS